MEFLCVSQCSLSKKSKNKRNVEKAMTKALHKKVERGKKFLSFFSVRFVYRVFGRFSARGDQKHKGRREKKRDESDVHLLRRLKKSSYLLCFIFYRFFSARFLGVS